MSIFSSTKKLIDGWHWVRQPGTNGPDDKGKGYPIKVWAKKTVSKYAKPAFIILAIVVLVLFVYEYSKWDGTWLIDSEAVDVELKFETE